MQGLGAGSRFRISYYDNNNKVIPAAQCDLLTESELEIDTPFEEKN